MAKGRSWRSCGPGLWALAIFLNPLYTAAAPNILFIMADQFRFDFIDPIRTPHLYGLGQQGATFVHHYSSTPSCTPARAAVLTGRSPWRHGMLGYGAVAQRYPQELATSMAAAGLHTVAIGKNHFGWNRTSDTPVAHGFDDLQIYDGLGNGFKNGSEFDDYDRWFQQQMPGQDPLSSGGLDWNSWRGAAYEYAERLHPTAWTGWLARRTLLSLQQASKPFFLKVSFHRPHSPYDPPARLLNATPPPARRPALASDGWDQRLRNCSAQGSPDAWCGEVDAESLTLARRAYQASVSFVDEEVGAILHFMGTLGMLSNTFILFTSDHGDMQMDHFLWRKSYPYEGSAHVPLLLRWPESLAGDFVDRGSTISDVTELRDLYPTFLEVVGAWSTSTEAELDGRPLTWLLRRNRGRHWRRWLDLEHDICYNATNHWSALTDGVIKFIFHACSGEEQLFDLVQDPGETRDLSKDAVRSLQLREWRQRMVAQFEDEGRGPDWVQHGVLQQRCSSCLYSPNYPGSTGDCRKAPAQVQLQFV